MPEPERMQNPWTSFVRHQVNEALFYRLDCDRKLSSNATKLLTYVGHRLSRSDYEDIALLPQDRWAKDVEMAADDAWAALKELVEREFLRVAKELAFKEGNFIAVQIMIVGMNDPRHEMPQH